MAKRTRVSFEYLPPPSIVRRPIADLFMRLKPTVILMTMLENDGCSISTIYKKSGDAQTMYGYVMNIIHEFRDAGMVETQKSGRTLSVHLTKKGIEIAKLVKLINEKLRAGVQECRKARNGTEC